MYNIDIYITPTIRRSHIPSSEDFPALSGGWMMLCKELIMAGDIPHITMQRIRTF